MARRPQQPTLYYNDTCSKCRATRTLLQSRGITPTVVDSLSTPPDAATLRRLAAGLAPAGARGLLRGSEPEAARLLASAATDEALIAAMVAEPRLIERPILQMADRAVVCRPPERALELIG